MAVPMENEIDFVDIALTDLDKRWRPNKSTTKINGHVLFSDDKRVRMRIKPLTRDN